MAHWFLCLDKVVNDLYSFQQELGIMPFLYLSFLILAPLLLLCSLTSKPIHMLDLPTIVLPPVPPWRCLPGRHYKGVQHYSLRLRCQKRLPFARRPRFLPVPPTKPTKSRSTDGFKPPPHWRHYSEEERLEDYDRMKHKWLHQSFIMIEAQFGISLDEFISTQDPAGLVHDIKLLAHSSFLETNWDQQSRAQKTKAAKVAALQILVAHYRFPLPSATVGTGTVTGNER